MLLKKLFPVAVGTAASAQSLVDVLASQNSSLSTLNSLLATQPSLISQLFNATNVTILAPSNDALGIFLNSSDGRIDATMPDIVSALLKYHVLKGTYLTSSFTNISQFIPTMLANSSYVNVTGGQRVEAMLNGSVVNFFSGLLQQSTVTIANLTFVGGVVHIINRVLTIPQGDVATAAAANLTSFDGALTQTDLVQDVDALQDVTIFAPSNFAFQSIGSSLNTLTTSQLASILTYHIINGTVTYSPSLTNTTLTTMNGESIKITVENGTVFVNSAKVLVPDILVSNGVVHIIDGVLNPNNTSAAPSPSTTVAAFSGASSVSTAPFTSGITASTTITLAPTRDITSFSKGFGNRLAMPTGALGAGMLFGGAAIALGGL